MLKIFLYVVVGILLTTKTKNILKEKQKAEMKNANHYKNEIKSKKKKFMPLQKANL